jgi:uncharacterized protein YpmS
MTRFRWLVAFLTLWATLGCIIFLGGPDYPTNSVPFSPEMGQTAQAQLKTAIAEATQSGRFTLTLTQEHLTALLNARLQERSGLNFKEPLVLLHPDVMEIYGKVQQGNVVANVKISLAVSVNAQGKPQFQIVSVVLGPLPLPQGVLESITAMLNEAFVGAVGPAATGLRLESIVIEEGRLTLRGRVR